MQSGLTSFGLQETGKLILQNSAVEYNSMKQFKVDDGWLPGPS